MPVYSNMTLSINRIVLSTPFNRTAPTNTPPFAESAFVRSFKVSGWTKLRYSTDTRPSNLSASCISLSCAAFNIARGDVPGLELLRSIPVLRACHRIRASSRWSGLRYAFRELRARPSDSRTVGITRISRGICKSRTKALRTIVCWISFWPKYARSGWMILKSLVTTVATPLKKWGRVTPSSYISAIVRIGDYLVWES